MRMVKHLLEHLLQIGIALGKTTWFILKLTKLDRPQQQMSSGGKCLTLHLRISVQFLFLFHAIFAKKIIPNDKLATPITGVGAPSLRNPESATALVFTHVN